MAGAVFALACALRMVADTNQGLHWLLWLSPLGWAEETRPTRTRWPCSRSSSC
jgi:ABC-2 type transport system permease protein